MKTYLVKVAVNIPYPKEYETRVEGSGFATASSRGIKDAIKQLKGRHLKEVRVKIIKL